MITDPTPEAGTISVVIVDDHGLIREGFRMLLHDEPGIEVVGEAERAHEAIDLIQRVAPDVVILDIRLPDRDGVTIVGDIREASPGTRILLCSGAPDDSVAADATDARADGFVAKEAPNDEIVHAVRAVASGDAVLGESSARVIFDGLRGRADKLASVRRLSMREREILGLLAEGLTNGEIAVRLSISPKTARNHVSRILRKLSLRYRTEAAVLAVGVIEHLRGDGSNGSGHRSAPRSERDPS
jgi:two-component system response regulator DevR